VYVKHLGADMKLHRARQVLQQLRVLHDQHLASDEVRLETSYDEEGTRTTRIRLDGPVPHEIPTLAGDAVRTAREALDELAVSLAVASRRTARGAAFPIAASAHAYPEEEARGLRHTNETARVAVRSVSPWRGADDVLWELQHLAWTQPLVVAVGQLVGPTTTRVPSPLSVLAEDTEVDETCRRLDDGSPLSWDATSPPTTPAEAGVWLVLASGSLLRGRPLLTGLDLLLTHTADVVGRVVSRAEAPATPSAGQRRGRTPP
jgi:hypothetical protein